MKLISIVKGLGKMIFAVKIFDPQKKFKNKRIAIIGPADSAFEKENGNYIDNFDYVIRINKAAHSWTAEKAKFIGKKTDVLYHSFFENNESGGGPLDVKLYQKLGIRYLINPRTTYYAYRRTLSFFERKDRVMNVYHLPQRVYKGMIKDFKGQIYPTIGYTALFSALSAPCEEIYISGFTFFKTPYADGYRDHLQDMNKNVEHIKKQGVHDIDLEFKLFRKYVRKTKSKKLLFDRKLNEIMESYEEEN